MGRGQKANLPACLKPRERLSSGSVRRTRCGVAHLKTAAAVPFAGSRGEAPGCFSWFVLLQKQENERVYNAIRHAFKNKYYLLAAPQMKHCCLFRSGRGGPSFSVRPEKEAKGAVVNGQRRHWYAFESLRCVRRGAQKLDRSRGLKQFVRSLACKQASPLTGPPGVCGACRRRPTDRPCPYRQTEGPLGCGRVKTRSYKSDG